MPDIKLMGILEFDSPLLCEADALGESVEIAIGGHRGKLTMPSLPAWGENESDPLSKQLVSPPQTTNWVRGDDKIFWGNPISYPSGKASVEMLFVELEVLGEGVDEVASEVYRKYQQWQNLFVDYVKLLTKMAQRGACYGSDEPGRLELFRSTDDKIKYIQQSHSIDINVELNDGEESLHLEQFRMAAKLSSEGFRPRLEYKILLEAYAAHWGEDYRKTIVEAATATEICLTSKIVEECEVKRIGFGDKLLKKYQALGGKFELARMLDIDLPERDYVDLIVRPRNGVVHRAEFPDRFQANSVVKEVEVLLQHLSPVIQELRTV